MPVINHIKTNFTAGVISQSLFGRSDLKAYMQGVQQLDNMVLHATGGVSRRPGLRLIHTLTGEHEQDQQARLAPFMFNSEQVYLICFRNAAIDIFWQDTLLATVEDSPFLAEHLSGLRLAMSADTMLITHQSVPPQKLMRLDEASWSLEPWAFYESDNRLHQPYFKFANDDVTLSASGKSGTITLTASKDFFQADHAGLHFRIQDKEVVIESVSSATTATATTRETLSATDATEDWQEPAFSSLHGYPNSLCFHQDRLFIGGSRDLPNRIWGSKSADLFNFDLGEGLDDEAIEVALLSDQVNRIEALFSGIHLQIFTTGAEWIIEGNPLTPTDMMLSRETRTGSKSDPHVAPCYIEGGTIFAAKGNPSLQTGGLCEFIYTDQDVAFQATDLTVTAKDIFTAPIDQAYDPVNRRLHVVQDNGTMTVLTLFRAEKVFGWSRFITAGAFLSVAAIHDQVYALIDRDSKVTIERFDHTLGLDYAITPTIESDSMTLSGLEPYQDNRIQVVEGDYRYHGEFTAVDGTLILPVLVADSATVGLGYEAMVIPLPPAIDGSSAAMQLGSVRLVRIILRLQDTAFLELDHGQGFIAVNLNEANITQFNKASPLFSGDKAIRVLGWHKQGDMPLWRLRARLPLPLTLLSVTNELGVY